MVEVAANHPLQPAPELGRMAVQVAQKARFDGLRRNPQRFAIATRRTPKFAGSGTSHRNA